LDDPHDELGVAVVAILPKAAESARRRVNHRGDTRCRPAVRQAIGSAGAARRENFLL
jgi:hypothetical protein